MTPEKCFEKYGDPKQNESKFMVMWDVPKELEIGQIPKKLYCNKDLVEPLTDTFIKLKETGTYKEIITWDGCFNIRLQRGSKTKMSIHSWGLAVDINAFSNPLGGKSNFSSIFVKCFTDSGFIWGGNFKRPDPMHFELK